MVVGDSHWPEYLAELLASLPRDQAQAVRRAVAFRRPPAVRLDEESGTVELAWSYGDDRQLLMAEVFLGGQISWWYCEDRSEPLGTGSTDLPDERVGHE